MCVSQKWDSLSWLEEAVTQTEGGCQKWPPVVFSHHCVSGCKLVLEALQDVFWDGSQFVQQLPSQPLNRFSVVLAQKFAEQRGLHRNCTLLKDFPGQNKKNPELQTDLKNKGSLASYYSTQMSISMETSQFIFDFLGLLALENHWATPVSWGVVRSVFKCGNNRSLSSNFLKLQPNSTLGYFSENTSFVNVDGPAGSTQWMQPTEPQQQNLWCRTFQTLLGRK